MNEHAPLLALHSSSERFGVAVLDSRAADGVRWAVFDDGRALSNTLLKRVESVLPSAQWAGLRGLAVATGPGGFTGTRLTVVMARTLAQQLECPLLGVSSYALMAARLVKRLSDPGARFWITRELPRRGVVAGAYQQLNSRMEELEPPHLLKPGRGLGPMVLEAEDDVEADVTHLLKLLQVALVDGESCPWQSVLPIYPTSPVGVV